VELWEWLVKYPWAGWACAALLLGVAELVSLDLVLLMLAAGAGVGAVAAALGWPFPVQALLAAATAVAMLVLVRPSVVRRLRASGPDLRHGAAALVGSSGFAVEEVSAHGGLVKLAGETWTARPYDEHLVIPPGTKVEVFEIRGATAYVHPVPELGG
jgi:membrane protein implicated in regulation of membrane protease activity